jgi:type IV secretion system protein VirB9
MRWSRGGHSAVRAGHHDARNREAPVLVVIGSDKKPEMVNYRLKGDMYIVDRLFDHAQLVIGGGKKSRKVEIKRESRN